MGERSFTSAGLSEASVFRILKKFLVGDGCWEWQASLTTTGYGQWGTARGGVRRCYKAHRLVYEIFKGPIPEGLELDHLCRNPLCVRPDHLEPVTHLENCRRGEAGQKTGAKYRAKTHCVNGHPFSDENTYWWSRNGRDYRQCRICRRLRDEESRARKRVA